MNFSETALAPVPREFLVVVLAGFGNDLSPLTNDHGEESSPKALLPVANKPMISYTLKWIEDSGLKEALVVCPNVHKKPLVQYLNSEDFNFSLNVKLEAYESDDPTSGTMEALSKLASTGQCQEDLVILPCDFFPSPSLSLSAILNQYRTANDGMIVQSVWYEQPASKESPDDLPGPSSAPLVVFDEKTNSLLHVDYSIPDQDDVTLRMGLAWKYPRARLSSQLVDSHVYVCKKGLLDIVAARAPQLESFREDFLPWLSKIQYRSSHRDRFASVLAPLTNRTEEDIALRHSTRENLSRNLSALSLSESSSPLDPCDSKDSNMRIGVAVQRASEGPMFRANNLLSYMELNRRMLKPGDKRALSEGLDAKASISPDSLIGASARVGEKSTIKKSAIGKHCTIGKNVRIVGSVIGDHCTIEEGSKIEGCILSRYTGVGEKAELTKCQTQAGYEVEAGEKIKGERLENNNWGEDSNEDEYDEESLLDGE